MYDIAVPMVITKETYCRETLLADLRAAGAKRVFLAISALSGDAEERRKVYDCLRAEIAFFKQTEMEVGVWFWAFWVNGDVPFEQITSIGGIKTPEEKCPLDAGFLDFMSEQLKIVAEMGPDMIMFDDDLRFSFFAGGFGCTCPLHRAKMAEILGAPVPEEADLLPAVFGGKKNPLRSAFLRANGDSMRNYARRARAAVDAVNPSIRLGQCACLGTYDLDGTDSFEMSHLLAGRTKPFLRLIGAPYWAAQNNWGSRLGDVVEMERQERAWYEASDIEIFSEGDAYPRPRFKVPAAYLELFDAALRADGHMDGILKYMLDYCASEDYERGYLKRHIKDEPRKQQLSRLVAGKTEDGIRIYDVMKKIEDADFSVWPVTPKLVQELCFPKAARMLTANSLPVIHRGTGCAGVAFGENARHLPAEAFEKPLIVDVDAARILQEAGHDVGIESVGELTAMKKMRITADRECVSLPSGEAYIRPVTLKPNATVHGTFADATREVPFCATYENAQGERYILLCYASEIANDEVWRNYATGKLMHRLLEAWNCPVPVKCLGNPDLSVICQRDEKHCVVALFNAFADEVEPAELTVPGDWESAEGFGCAVSCTGDAVKIEHIPAFGYCFVQLTAK